jgi:DNA-binding protein WhiA
MRENKNLNRNHAYEILIDGAASVLEDLDILREGSLFNDGLPESLLEKDCCRKAYLRGVFLGGGSLSTPEKSYHLELVTHNVEYAEHLTHFMNENYDLGAKYTERKNNYIVYIKESEKIVDFLNVIGAHKTLLEYENVRIIKQMRNNINRVINCETANMNKAIEAAYEQLDAIKAIEAARGIRTLPTRLREIAELRLDNPDATLKELGDMLTPAIGKSGVNHRLKKM